MDVSSLGQRVGAVSARLGRWRRRLGSWTKALRDPSITPSRAASILLSRLSYRARTARSLGLPRILYIETTNACNLHCTICPTGIGNLDRPKANMSLDDFKRLIDQGRGSLTRIIFSGLGEPFINPRTYEMIAYARSQRIFTSVCSNLLLLDDDDLNKVIDSGLDLLTVSIDLAPEGKNWRFVRKTDKDIALVKDRLGRLAELKRERGKKLPFVSVSYPVTKENESTLDQAREFATEVGADEFSTKSVNATLAGQDAKAMIEKHVSLRFSRYHRPKEGHGFCQWPYKGAMIYANGDISPCCHLGRGEHKLGNVFNDGLAGVWNGDKYKKFRLKLMHEPETVDHCAGCVERFGGI